MTQRFLAAIAYYSMTIGIVAGSTAVISILTMTAALAGVSDP